MPAPVLQSLADAVTKMTNVIQGAVTTLNTVNQRIQNAVNEAMKNGATAQELAPVQAEVDALNASANDLATAIVANTPANPSPTPAP